ncbi:MAG: hypothetical protein RI575_07220 [Balneolaceae bacterium]|nr:hypothetical protein [Balneolaceae bacterium]
MKISLLARKYALAFILVLEVSLFLTIGSISVFAQSSSGTTEENTNTSGSLNSLPSLFIDCSFCDDAHIRQEIIFVNYVRDPEQANIHLFMTRTRLSRGGAEYEISFIGLKRFADLSIELSYTADRDETWSETRDSLNNIIRSALMPYLSQTPLLNAITYEVDTDVSGVTSASPEDDPWDFWVFEAYVGSIELELESNQKVFDSRWGIFADRITNNWKLRFRPYFNYDYVEIEQEGEKNVVSTVERHGIDSYAIKSIDRHWSVGLFATYLTRNDLNTRNRIEVNPGVEYSFLPYSVATRRAVTLRYLIGYTWYDYFDRTIFGKTEQHLLNHQLQGSVDIQQPWGSVAGGIVGSHYLHDIDLRRIEFFGSVSVRLVEGLSLRISSGLEMIQDQLTLRAGDTSIEDILLRRRELATDFEFSGSVAVTYTFGSDFANIVNTRFF